MMQRAVRLSWEGRPGLAVTKASRLRSDGKASRPRSDGKPPTRRATAEDSVVFSRPDGSALHRGNNVDVMRDLSKTALGERVTLAYLDPPFLTNRVHEARNREKRTVRAAFDDRWPDRASYLDTLGARLSAVRTLLAPHGCGRPRRPEDEPLREGALRRDLRRRLPSRARSSGVIAAGPPRPRTSSASTTCSCATGRDAQVEAAVQSRSTSRSPPPPSRPGAPASRAPSSAGTAPSRSSVTPEATPGVPLGDVWEIGVIAPVARERTGYPSQKPEALLDRLVCALSTQAMLVLDPYAGSGTTLAVAAKLGASPSSASTRATSPSRRALAGRARLQALPRPKERCLRTGARAYA
jgi:site-specific DNA-methyltransferase (adenine-specific)